MFIKKNKYLNSTPKSFFQTKGQSILRADELGPFRLQVSELQSVFMTSSLQNIHYFLSTPRMWGKQGWYYHYAQARKLRQLSTTRVTQWLAELGFKSISSWKGSFHHTVPTLPVLDTYCSALAKPVYVFTGLGSLSFIADGKGIHWGTVCKSDTYVNVPWERND